MFKIGIVPKVVFFFFLLALLNGFIVYLIFGQDLLVFFILSTFVFLALRLSLIAKKRIDNYSVLLARLIKNNLEEKVDASSSDEFGKLDTSLEAFRTGLRERILLAEESKDRAEAILFNVGEGVFAINLRGEIIIFNQVAQQLIGFTRNQVLGQRYDQILQFFNTATKEHYGSFINKVLLDGKTITLPAETVIISAAQNQIPVAATASPIKNQKGVIVGGIVVFRDTTREKELEEMRNDLISIASHQLRTPLSEIKGLIELLTDKLAGPLTNKQMEYLSMLTSANERMINLVNDLLNISRLEQGRLQFRGQIVDLGILAKQVYDNLKMAAAKKSQNFFLTADSNEHLVWVDSDKTKEIISNLLENALKYTYEGGTIHSRVSSDASGVWFLVKDSGVGIPKNRQKDLFKKFSRVESPLSSTTTGTGLGLYTVKQLVEKQRGKLWFQSQEGKGSTFAFVLPHAKILPQ